MEGATSGGRLDQVRRPPPPLERRIE